jgi:hypothetical protein
MMDVSEDLYPSHDNRTVDTPLGGADIWPYQQFDRATDRADGSASVAGAAATPSARQLGSSTDSCSEPEMIRAAVSKCQSLAMVMYATVDVHQGEATQESYSAMLHKKTGVATVIFPMSRVHKKLVFGKPETWPVVQPEYPVF